MDRLFKAIVAICLIFIAIACTVYSSDMYKRQEQEQKAWDYCTEIVSLVDKGQRWPEESAPIKQAVLWTAIRRCVISGNTN